MRVVPNQLAVGGRGAAEKRGHEADAVAVQIGAQGQSGQLEQGWDQIHCNGGPVGDGARPADARRADDQRNADAALVQPSLAGAQRQIAGGAWRAAGAEAAVVRSEHDDRVRAETERVEPVKDMPHRVIHGGDHAVIFGMVLARAGENVAFANRLVWRRQRGGLRARGVNAAGVGVQRRVDVVIGVVQKKRSGGIAPFDEPCGFLREAVAEILALRPVGEAG